MIAIVLVAPVTVEEASLTHINMYYLYWGEMQVQECDFDAQAEARRNAIDAGDVPQRAAGEKSSGPFWALPRRAGPDLGILRDESFVPDSSKNGLIGYMMIERIVDTNLRRIFSRPLFFLN